MHTLHYGPLMLSLPRFIGGEYTLHGELPETARHWMYDLPERATQARRGGLVDQLDIDEEEDTIFIIAESRDAMLWLLDQLAQAPSIVPYNDASAAEVRAVVAAHRPNQPIAWKLGSVFLVPLADRSSAVGQVVLIEQGDPSCALFDIHLPPGSSGWGLDIVGARALAILHLPGDALRDGTWPVVQDFAPVPTLPMPIGPYEVGGVSYGSDGIFSELAEACLGLRPWNVGLAGTAEYYDEMLLSGVGRPSPAWILSKEERAACRAQRGITAGDP